MVFRTDFAPRLAIAAALALAVPGAFAAAATSPDGALRAPATASAPAAKGVPGAGAAATPPADGFPFKVSQTTLANGLKVVVIPYDSPGTVAYFTLVRAGSRDEVEAGHSGFAHFFEHMMFRGTEKYPVDRYNDLVKEMGADSNAETTEDFTLYHTIGPVSRLDTIADMEADRFKNLKYSQEDFRTEALAILGEYNKDAASPFLPLQEKMRDTAFTRHTYKHTALGFLADIKAMPESYDYSRGFFDRFYRPENCIVVVVGDVQPAAVFAVVEREYGDWKRGYKAAAIVPEPPQQETRHAHVDWPSPIQPVWQADYHIPAYSDDSVEGATLNVIAQLLFSPAAPLYQDLTVDKQWSDLLVGSADLHRDPNTFTILARAKSADLVPKIDAAVAAAIADLQGKPVAADRLARTVEHVRNAFLLQLKTPGDVAYQVSTILALTGDVRSLDSWLTQYTHVTAADVQRVAREIFRPTNETIVTLSGPAAAGASPQGGAHHAHAN